MCNITENFMDDQLYFLQLKQDYEYQMWCKFIEEEEEKEKADLLQAEQHFKDLETYENSIMEKEYKELLEWDLIN
jgi:hypothetical protein